MIIIPRKIRRILCKLNIHFKPDWSHDYWTSKTYCAYCRRIKGQKGYLK